MFLLKILWIIIAPSFVLADPSIQHSLFDYPNIKDELYDQQVSFMAQKSPHTKDDGSNPETVETTQDPWSPFDFSKVDTFLNENTQEAEQIHNRIRRRARKRNRTRGSKRRNRARVTTAAPDDESKNQSSTEVPIARAGNTDSEGGGSKKKKNKKKMYDMYEPPIKQYESGFVEMPKDLYQAHLRPGVIFRIHMSEAVLKMQYRNYGEDKDESVIEADVEYLRLTRKVINDEITKFEDLQWLTSWFLNRSELISEHMCNTRYYSVGTPPTMFTHSEEYMKRLCLFDAVYIDHIPYVIGDDSSLMAAVAPPVLHCDAATCTSVPFIDSIMFDERYSRTNVRTLTRCQASCRAHCRNDPDCLKRCSDRCLRTD